MKDLSRILWGIVLVLLGIIWGLNATGITNIDIFFEDRKSTRLNSSH